MSRHWPDWIQAARPIQSSVEYFQWNSISEPWYSPVKPYLSCVPLTLMLELQRPEESIGSLGTGCELACGFGELKTGTPEKQPVLLSDESSLQTLVLSFWLSYTQSWASKSKNLKGNFLSGPLWYTLFSFQSFSQKFGVLAVLFAHKLYFARNGAPRGKRGKKQLLEKWLRSREENSGLPHSLLEPTSRFWTFWWQTREWWRKRGSSLLRWPSSPLPITFCLSESSTAASHAHPDVLTNEWRAGMECALPETKLHYHVLNYKPK